MGRWGAVGKGGDWEFTAGRRSGVHETAVAEVVATATAISIKATPAESE